jgi:hypothetical protein
MIVGCRSNSRTDLSEFIGNHSEFSLNSIERCKWKLSIPQVMGPVRVKFNLPDEHSGITATEEAGAMGEKNYRVVMSRRIILEYARKNLPKYANIRGWVAYGYVDCNDYVPKNGILFINIIQ